MADTKFNVTGIITIISTILMIVGVFLAWTSGTVDVLIGQYSGEYSGWELATCGEEDKILSAIAAEIEYSFVPLAILAIGAIGLIMNIVPIFSSGALGKIFSGLNMLIAVVAIILSILFYTSVTGDITIEGYKFAEFGVGLGFWMSLFGSLVFALGSIFSLAKQKA